MRRDARGGGGGGCVRTHSMLVLGVSPEHSPRISNKTERTVAGLKPWLIVPQQARAYTLARELAPGNDVPMRQADRGDADSVYVLGIYTEGSQGIGSHLTRLRRVFS